MKAKGVKREYLNAIEHAIAMDFMDGKCVEELTDGLVDRATIECVIRRAMKMRRWWVRPRTRRSK